MRRERALLPEKKRGNPKMEEFPAQDWRLSEEPNKVCRKKAVFLWGTWGKDLFREGRILTLTAQTSCPESAR